MQLIAIADFVGSLPATQLATTGQAKYIIFSATGSGAARVGDSTVAAGKGAAVTAGTSIQITQNQADATDFYSLNQIYVFVPAGCTLSVSYAP